MVIHACLAPMCRIIMPGAIPTYAIVYSSGELRIADMARAIFMLTIAAICMIVLMMLTTVPMVFNV